MIIDFTYGDLYQYSNPQWPVWNYSGPVGIAEGLIFDRPAIPVQVIRERELEPFLCKIRNTGESSDPSAEQYRHTIYHNLKREPIGCRVIWGDDLVSVKVVSQDSNKIIVVFDKARAQVNLRIW